jgi:hypothetical protein
MFRWLRKRAEQKARACAEAECLIAEHGGQTRHVLADHIRELEATGRDTKELWAVMREVRKRSGDEGLDTGTKYIDSEKPKI